MLLAASRILWPQQRVCAVGSDGAGAHRLAGTVAVRACRRVGKSAGPGSDSGSAHLAPEAECAVCGNRPGGSLECPVGGGVDCPTPPADAGAGFLCRRTRACVPRGFDEIAAALRSTGTVLSARHGRLLGQCTGWAALFLRE